MSRHRYGCAVPDQADAAEAELECFADPPALKGLREPDVGNSDVVAIRGFQQPDVVGADEQLEVSVGQRTRPRSLRWP